MGQYKLRNQLIAEIRKYPKNLNNDSMAMAIGFSHGDLFNNKNIFRLHRFQKESNIPVFDIMSQNAKTERQKNQIKWLSG